MPVPGSKSSRHLFAEPPTSAQLSALLVAPRADYLSYSSQDKQFEVTIAPRPIWFLLPGLIWFGFVVVAAPWIAPLWGGQFIGWGLWLTLLLFTWAIVLPAALVLLSWLVQRQSAGDAVVVVDRKAEKLYLPNGGRAIVRDELFQVVELIRWADDRKHWRPVVQTSLVLTVTDGGYELVPLVIQLRPSRVALPLADRIATAFQVPVTRVRLDGDQSRTV